MHLIKQMFFVNFLQAQISICGTYRSYSVLLRDVFLRDIDFLTDCLRDFFCCIRCIVTTYRSAISACEKGVQEVEQALVYRPLGLLA